MQYEQRYRIIKTDGSVIEGTYIQTKGNDEDYPTFVLADGSLLGVHRDAVLGPVTDDCPVDGIPRTITSARLVSWGPTTDPDAPGYIVSVEPVNGE
jgi:hypothetical protein